MIHFYELFSLTYKHYIDFYHLISLLVYHDLCLASTQLKEVKTANIAATIICIQNILVSRAPKDFQANETRALRSAVFSLIEAL